MGSSLSRRGVLFDLDGTLLDTAADLYAALERLCAEQGRRPPAYAASRRIVSSGARAMLRQAFPERDAAAIEALLPVYLAHYQAALLSATRPFPGIEALLTGLEEAGMPWGIVTNKAEYLARALVEGLGWQQRLSVLVGGDTLAHKKPDPAPVLYACAEAGIDPGTSVFVGDDSRDVGAGRAAGLTTVVVDWGYLGDTAEPARWGADRYVARPAELAAWLCQPG